MTAVVPNSASRAIPTVPVVVRLALRDLRGGIGGYWIFLLCIALGVAAIVGVGSVAGSLGTGLAREGRTILGGDIAVSSVSQPVPTPVLTELARRGRLSSVIATRAMARHADAPPMLVDVKAVDGAYPMTGSVGLEPPQPIAAALAQRGDAFGLVAEDTIGARLDLHVGDSLRIGDADFVLMAVLKSEPDRLAGGIAFAPRVLMSTAAIEAAGLIKPGSIARFTSRLDLGGPRAIDDAGVARIAADVKAAFREAGLDIKTRGSVSPEFDRNLERFTQFLTLIGLTALVVGGVGIANAVQAAMQRKRVSLAILKALGASGRAVFVMGLVQVMLVAALGIAAGLLVGAALPFGLAAFLGALIPFPLVASVYPGVLALGALYGVLTTLVFSLAPLGRAHDVPVSALFRDAIAPDPSPLRRVYRAAIAVAVLALAGVAIGCSTDHRLALFYVAATLVVFFLLRLVAAGFMRLARGVRHPRGVEWRLALSNIHRPGALTPAVVLSLGLGLTLLVTLSLIDDNIRRQVEAGQPGVTPSFFFVDVPNRQAGAFSAFVTSNAPGVTMVEVPMMRGRIVALNGVAAETIKPTGDAAWVLEGDRGITFADAVPAGSALVAGAWWPPDYHGTPLVSFDADLARGIGVKLGDTLGVNVLGRTVTARIASLRKIDWQSMGINFVMVFSPNTFAGAPHMVLATATFPAAGGEAPEIALEKAVSVQYPTITIVRVKDVLTALSALLGKLAVAIRIAAAVTITASVLVLAGALAAGRQARIYDAVVLKVLGATRGRLLLAYVIEYGLLGGATAMFGIAAGTLAAYAVVVHVMKFDFTFTLVPALLAAGASLLVTVGLGLVGTWRILGQSPAAFLRDA